MRKGVKRNFEEMGEQFSLVGPEGFRTWATEGGQLSAIERVMNPVNRSPNTTQSYSNSPVVPSVAGPNYSNHSSWGSYEGANAAGKLRKSRGKSRGKSRRKVHGKSRGKVHGKRRHKSRGKQ